MLRGHCIGQVCLSVWPRSWGMAAILLYVCPITWATQTWSSLFHGVRTAVSNGMATCSCSVPEYFKQLTGRPLPSLPPRSPSLPAPAWAPHLFPVAWLHQVCSQLTLMQVWRDTSSNSVWQLGGLTLLRAEPSLHE